MSSVFTKIINGELPSYKVYENDYVYSFLTIEPIQAWHTLIVPKKEVDYFVDVPEPRYSEVFKAAKYITPFLQQATNTSRVATMILWLEVPHFHYHLIPFFDISDIDLKKAKKVNDEELFLIHKRILKSMHGER